MPSSKSVVVAALDESPGTLGERFAKEGIENTLDNRRRWRGLLLSTPGISDHVAGVILHEEMIFDPIIATLVQALGLPMIAKTDAGLAAFRDSPSEQITLVAPDILEKHRRLKAAGVAATKFRSVFRITDQTPTASCILANAEVQAYLAWLAVTNDLTPMVEPEVLRAGAHSIEQCGEVTRLVHQEVFGRLQVHGVRPDQMLLKMSMITAGEEAPEESPARVAEFTRACVEELVPSLAGVNHLSGGQSDSYIEQNLNAIAWAVADLKLSGASFGRALTRAALSIWKGDDANREAAQAAFFERLVRCAAARQGRLSKLVA